MKKISLEICLGTTCYVMGASELQNIEDHLTESQKKQVDILGVSCLNCCKDRKYGKAPYVRLDGEIISEVTLETLLARIAEKTTQE